MIDDELQPYAEAWTQFAGNTFVTPTLLFTRSPFHTTSNASPASLYQCIGDACGSSSRSTIIFRMPKFVRRQPLIERIKAYLDPADWLLYISEELDTNGLDQLEKEWAIPIGMTLNLVFLIARSNQQKQSSTYDDVFGEVRGTGWFAWLVSTEATCGNTITDRCCTGIIPRPLPVLPLIR
jgi:hypothetical protein